MKAYLKKKFSTLYFFYQFLGYRIVLLLLFSFFMVLMDSLGMTLFIPLLQVADSTEVGAGSDNTAKVVQNLFQFLHMEVSVMNMLILIVVLFILKGIFFYYLTNFIGITQQRFSKAIRERLAIGLSDLSYKEFVSTDIGRMQNSLTGESWQVVYASSQYLESIKNGFFIISYLGFAFFLDWKFSILVVIGGGLSNFIYQAFYKKTQDLSRDITKNNHRYGGIVIEVINHFKYMKATGRNTIFFNRLRKELTSLIKNNISVVVITSRLSALREPMTIAVIAGAIAVHVLIFKSPLSAVMIILLFFYRAMQKIIDLQINWNNYLSNIGTVENIISFQEYLDQHKEDLGGAQTFDSIKQISLQNITLSYGDHQVLKDINLQLSKNESIAFVGESGSGKTSLVNLICTLIPANTGAYTVNGVDIGQVSINDFRSKIGYISQEATVFNASIFENVTFWEEKNEHTLAKFNKVIDMCSLRSFLTNLPAQEETLLGNNGLNVSGGQKQRISIARELYRDVEILIMDEATSALDSETEAEIKKSIDSLHGQVTIISIAHRLSTIQHVDTIYLMENGKIAAFGDFEELKNRSNYFKKLTELQGM